MKEVLSELEDLFVKAKQTNEFEFILTLINYKSIGAMDSTSNLHEWFDSIEFYKALYNGLEDKEKTRIGCLLYSTFFENSDFYNILGSLCNILMGYRGSSYLYWKTKKLERLLGTGEKIEMVSEKLDDCKKVRILKFFEDNHFQSIRNSFFHSAYSLSDGHYILHDTEAIRIEGLEKGSFESKKFLYPLIENVTSFFDTFRKLYFDSFSSYKEEKVIKGFFPNLTDIFIHGTEKGLRGFTVKNTAQFYGVWVDSMILYDEKNDMWFAKNIQFGHFDIEKIELDEQLTRYEKKDNIHKADAEFFNMVDKVVQRYQRDEMPRIINLLIKFGDKKYDEWTKEQNIFRKNSLPKAILLFYERTILLNLHLDLKEIKKRINEIKPK